MSEIDVQVDRVVGPTQHFGGLGVGNVASIVHAGQVSHPAAAALEGLDKMRLLASLGMPQLILPPQRRPAIRFLRGLGFSGSDRELLRAAYATSHTIFSAAWSCSAMWTANAATVTAAADSRDGRIKLSIANLSSSMHRALESAETQQQLESAFRAVGLAAHSDFLPPLEAGVAFRDEGAANHMRLTGAAASAQPAINLFIHGDGEPLPSRYLPRQSRLAFEMIARRHGLAADRTYFIKQHPDAIDAGAFHNDVVAMNHGDLLIHHERAFWQADPTFAAIETQFQQLTGAPLHRVVVADAVLSLEDAIRTYLFNSQIVTTPAPESQRVLICPSQVREHVAAMRLVQSWCNVDRWFDAVHFVHVQESMSGGGGPACLRLRVPVEREKLAATSANAWWSESTDAALRAIIEADYPQQLTLSDLSDPDRVRHLERTTERIEQLLLGR